MRTMFVLRGAPGAGKTTLIRRHRLGDLAIGLDDFRRLYSAPFTDLDGMPTLSMAFGAEKQVVAAFKAAVTARIRQGGTVLLDCTNPSRRSYREFASLARRCGYEVYVVDVQGELTDDELIERNETRHGALDYVEPGVVVDIAARVRAGAASVTERLVDLDEVRRLNTIIETDITGRYERLVIIGDEILVEDALRDAHALLHTKIRRAEIQDRYHDMPLVLLVVVVIRVDDSLRIDEHELMLERDSRADVQPEILILLHVRLESRRHDCHLAARQ